MVNFGSECANTSYIANNKKLSAVTVEWKIGSWAMGVYLTGS
jgi:hypothetical protein